MEMMETTSFEQFIHTLLVEESTQMKEILRPESQNNWSASAGFVEEMERLCINLMRNVEYNAHLFASHRYNLTEDSARSKRIKAGRETMIMMDCDIENAWNRLLSDSMK